MVRSPLYPGLAAVMLGLFGCEQAAPPTYAPNLVYRNVVETMADLPLGAAGDDVNAIVSTSFGTPDNKHVPEAASEAISAAPLADGQAAYEKYCAACHGTNGDGRGPAAALLTPYPRDYRPGIFKFKSSLPGEKPLKSDIADIVARGVPGTAMKPIPELNADQRDAVAEYVVFLSTRGELERTLLMTAAFELDLEGGERFIPPNPLPEDYSGMDAEESAELVTDLTTDIADGWLDAESYLEEVEVPEYFSDQKSEDFAAAAKRGAEHFKTKEAACATCHRFDEQGNPITTDKKLYDVWTEEWTTRIQLDPTDEKQLIPIMARGALPPHEVYPRRLGYEPLRGGDDPRAVFSKIKFGIEGTPMPKAQLADNDVLWDLVAYVLAETAKVPTEETATEPASSEPTTETTSNSNTGSKLSMQTALASSLPNSP